MEKSINLYLLSKYFCNESSNEEEQLIKNWVNISEKNKEILNEAKRIWINDQKVKQLSNWLPYILENIKCYN